MIAYASRTLDECQKRYGAAKLEMFGALKMIEKFSPYLCMRKFVLRVDCAALSWLKTYAIQQNSLAARWIARLEGFNFEVKQRKRELHQNADGLSKRTQDLEVSGNEVMKEEDTLLPFLSKEQNLDLVPLTVNSEGEIKLMRQSEPESIEEPLYELTLLEAKEAAYLPFLSIEQQRKLEPRVPWSYPVAIEACKLVQMGPRYDVDFLREKKELDPSMTIMKKILALTEESRKTQEPLLFNQLSLSEKRWFNKHRERLVTNKSGVFCLKGKLEMDPYAIVLPDFFKNEILQETHESMGHQGVTKVVDKVTRHFVWPGVKCDAQRHIAACMMCQQGKPPQKKLRTRLKPITTEGVNELVMIDFEQLSESYDGFKGFLVMVDHFSKFVVAAPLKAFTALEAARAIWEKWVLICGLPEVVHSDRGSQFESNLFLEVLRHMGCVKTHTSGYHPQGNGLAERMNRTITNMLLKSCEDDQTRWTEQIPKVLYAYNTMKNATTGYTPFRLMHGREATSPLSMIFAEYNRAMPIPVHEYVAKQMADMARVSTIVRDNVKQAQIRMARNHDKRMSDYPVLRVDQYAMRFTDVIKKKNHMKKLTRRWRGPFKIVKVYDHGLGYLFEDGQKAHYERVKRYEPRMKDFKLSAEGEFEWKESTLGEPILQIHPEDSEDEGGGEWEPETSEKGKPGPGKHVRLRKCKELKEETWEDPDDRNENYVKREDESSTESELASGLPDLSDDELMKHLKEWDELGHASADDDERTQWEDYVSNPSQRTVQECRSEREYLRWAQGLIPSRRREGEEEHHSLGPDLDTVDEQDLSSVMSYEPHGDSDDDHSLHREQRVTNQKRQQFRILEHLEATGGQLDTYSDCEKWAQNVLLGDDLSDVEGLFQTDVSPMSTTKESGMERHWTYLLESEGGATISPGRRR